MAGITTLQVYFSQGLFKYFGLATRTYVFEAFATVEFILFGKPLILICDEFSKDLAAAR